jgi:hypothetical protein
MTVRPFEYMIGRQNGRFTTPTDPLLFRKKNNKKTQDYNNNAAYPIYSHETYNNTCNSNKNYNNYDSYKMQPSSY